MGTAMKTVFRHVLAFLCLISGVQAFISSLRGIHIPVLSAATTQVVHPKRIVRGGGGRVVFNMSTKDAPQATALPTWSDLKSKSAESKVGSAINKEVSLRQSGKGSAHVQNSLRLFNSEDTPKLTLYRDVCGWCPYCQKTMLLIEEKEIPIKISLVPMRSYGDKPPEFLRKVPSGLLPALEVEDENGGSKIITESQVVMELLDQWHPKSEGYKPMLPDSGDANGWAKVQELSKLERELFSWWCTLVFRPEGPSVGGNVFDMIKGKGSSSALSGAMTGFLDCMRKVDDALESTSGPWFFDDYDYPTMIDFVYVSHVERMLASCAQWKGLDLRDPKWNFKGLNKWLKAFEKRECYLAFKSDYYTHVMDIPPQYGPGYDGGFEEDRKSFSNMILGKGDSWTLPLPHDDPLQPLYHGPPLPLAVLDAMGIAPDEDGSYNSCDPAVMAKACREFAAWKLADNGENVSRFAARGGPAGASNPRKTFGAELADPYAAPDDAVQPYVDGALRVVCQALMVDTPDSLGEKLKDAVPERRGDVAACLAYLRDRVGVPRDMPLAAARYFRAYLNWAIGELR